MPTWGQFLSGAAMVLISGAVVFILTAMAVIAWEGIRERGSRNRNRNRNK